MSFEGKFIHGLKRLYRQTSTAMCRSGCHLWRIPGSLQQAPRRLHQPRLGRLCETVFRRAVPGVAVPRPLHPSGGHLQSSASRVRWRARHLSLEGLRAWRQTEKNDSFSDRVPAPLLSTCAAQGIRTYPAFRIPHQPASRRNSALPSAGPLLSCESPCPQAREPPTAPTVSPLAQSTMRHGVMIITRRVSSNPAVDTVCQFSRLIVKQWHSRGLNDTRPACLPTSVFQVPIHLVLRNQLMTAKTSPNLPICRSSCD